jgi:hypothetical protein
VCCQQSNRPSSIGAMTIVRRRPASRCAIALAFALLFASAPSAGAAGATDIAGGATAPDAAVAPTTGATTARTPTIATATTSPSSPATTPPAGTDTSSTAIGSAGSATTLSKTSSGSPAVARQHPSGGSELSGGAILAAVLAGLIALACLVWAAFRWLAVEPRWTLPVRHSIAEAGFRASAIWAEFADWVRLGH